MRVRFATMVMICVMGATGVADDPKKKDKPDVVRLTVGKDKNHVNVMGKDVPPIPKFPQLEKKTGLLRGYVFDAAGKPLKGAVIGVRSTAVGGTYSGASAESDDKGYYEVLVPRGAAHLYAAGYTIDYADGRAALALHPANGKLSPFTSVDGAVENFVLWPFGIADRDTLSENPRLGSNFYGGSLYIGCFTSEPDDNNAPPQNLTTGTEIEITLTPKGKLIDGSESKEIIIKKSLNSGGFWINNIPVTQYQLKIQRADGKPLQTKLTRPTDLTFGIEPKLTTSTSLLSLYPSNAKAGMVSPGRGSWSAVEVNIEIPKGK